MMTEGDNDYMNIENKGTTFTFKTLDCTAFEHPAEIKRHNSNPEFSKAPMSSSTAAGSSASSTQNSDEEDYGDMSTPGDSTQKEKRREAHTEAERKRREAIKSGYDELQALVPTCKNSDSLGATKISKAVILQRSIDYIQHLHREKKSQDASLDKMRKDVMALKIMKANYDLIVQAHQNTHDKNQEVSDEVKFQVFQAIMDNLFQTFNATVSVDSFAELSGCVFSWLEEYCQPPILKDLTKEVLGYVCNQI